jgi:hypothetical protein
MPLRESEFFEISNAKTSKSVKNRARKTPDPTKVKIQPLTTQKAKTMPK